MAPEDRHKGYSCQTMQDDRIDFAQHIGPVVVSINQSCIKFTSAYIVKYHALSLIEAHSERPFLPFNDMASLARPCHSEACALRLNYIEWFQIRSQILMFWCILIPRGNFKRLSSLHLMIVTSRTEVYPNDFERNCVHHWRNCKRKSIVV